VIHLGDITKISGYTAPIVDVVVGGSPCQDLSVAGKRAGLDGERSGLFMEQLRIIKEMRENDRRNGRSDEHIRPRYMVWENVPGAFSSNKAEDFRIVLEETAKVKDPQCSIPMPDSGKWTTAGCILGDGWSIAWRVLDAQFWGVPQRRRRIALIADFGGHSAPEILFVSKSLSRDTESSKPQGKETPSDASRGAGANDSIGVDLYNGKITHDKAATISAFSCATNSRNGPYVMEINPIAYCFEPGAAKRLGGYVWEDLAPTLRTEVGDNRPSVAYTIDQGGGKSACNVQEGQAPTLTCTHGGEPVVRYSKSKRVQSDTDYETWKESDVANTINAFDVGDKRTTECVVGVDSYNLCLSGDIGRTLSTNGTPEHMPCIICAFPEVNYNQFRESNCELATLKARGGTCGDGSESLIVAAVDCRNCTESSDINGTLQAHMAGGTSLNLNNVVRVKYIVRRLTPLECERLQGYPDGWTDIGEWTDSKGKVHKTSDAARYKALGNSIALPPWKWVLKRLSACYERDATLASLFDGIGGFPLIWEQINGKGTCLWASEIEEFPIAVTKKRIGE
jgi:DNA (cytosine-5)-methyltransferase 1